MTAYEKDLFNSLFKVCPWCGATFVCRDNRHWGFVREGKRLCSYSCLRECDKATVPERKKRFAEQAEIQKAKKEKEREKAKKDAG